MLKPLVAIEVQEICKTARMSLQPAQVWDQRRADTIKPQIVKHAAYLLGAPLLAVLVGLSL